MDNSNDYNCNDKRMRYFLQDNRIYFSGRFVKQGGEIMCVHGKRCKEFVVTRQAFDKADNRRNVRSARLSRPR